MHNMFDENAEHRKFLRLFPSLLGSRSKDGDNCGLINQRPSEPASSNRIKIIKRRRKNDGQSLMLVGADFRL